MSSSINIRKGWLSLLVSIVYIVLFLSPTTLINSGDIFYNTNSYNSLSDVALNSNGNIIKHDFHKNQLNQQVRFVSPNSDNSWYYLPSKRALSPLNTGINISTLSLRNSTNKGGVPLSLSQPTDGSKLFRGDTITVTGQLRSSAPNDYWDDETVDIYYNITESQFKTDPTGYKSSNYFVTSTTTNSQGIFTATISTSKLSNDFRSKVGLINIFTWFGGDPELGRGSGSPGAVNVSIYGGMKIDVSYSVTNPSQPYSFTTSVVFDNNTIVPTSGSQYNLNITWLLSGRTDTATNYTFTASNDHTYSGTAPGTVQSVRYESYYDLNQLSIPYFIEDGDTSFSNTLLHKIVTDKTSEQVVVDAYYVTAAGLTESPIEIPLDSYITVYANVTNSTGLVGAGYNITAEFHYSSTIINTTVTQTNSSGEIQFDFYVDHNDISDITISNAFYVTFTANTNEFGGATITGDKLNSNLAVNISSITITLTDSTKFYTSGINIGYTVAVYDEFGRLAPLSQFIVYFPGLSSATRTAGSNGQKTLSSLIPDYGVSDQTPTKQINVSAQVTVGTNYKYYLNGGGPIVSNVAFNIYYELTVKFMGPYDSDITDSESVSFFNNTYYNLFQTGNYYNLSVKDAWDRNPVGAPISINLNGQIVNAIVTSGNNIVSLNPNFDPTTGGLNLSTAGIYTLTGSAGEGHYVKTISSAITIYGPDNDAPVIVGETLTPNPLLSMPHVPYYNISFSVTVTDVGTGVREVNLWYQILEPDGQTVKQSWTSIGLIYKGSNVWTGWLNTTTLDSLCYVNYYLVAKDFAGYGLQENGTRQAAAQYDENFGWTTQLYNSTTPQVYQIGDYAPPVQQAVPLEAVSPDPSKPYINITVFVNDSEIYTGISQVLIYINRTVYGESTPELWVNGSLMTHIPGTNAWFYQLNATYNYQYSWYYIAYDNAFPSPNSFVGQTYTYEAVDNTAPTIYTGSVTPNTDIHWNDTLSFSVRVTDDKTGVGAVYLHLLFYFPNGTLVSNETMLMFPTINNQFMFNVSLIVYNHTVYGTYSMIYYFEATDRIGNIGSTVQDTLSISNPAPPDLPPGQTNSTMGAKSSIGGIVGGAIGGIVLLIGALFLWYNRHSLKNYAKQQALKRRLHDYLNELIDDIKRSGSEGHYKEAIMKSWQVLEGIGREFYNTPRFKNQTTQEYARSLSRRSKIELNILNTISDYYEKARYGIESITENDYSATVQSLMVIISQLELGEMKIET